MINRDIALWVSERMRAAQRSSPAIIPPPAGTVFDPQPMPAFVRTIEVCRGGGGDAPARAQQHRCAVLPAGGNRGSDGGGGAGCGSG